MWFHKENGIGYSQTGDSAGRYVALPGTSKGMIGGFRLNAGGSPEYDDRLRLDKWEMSVGENYENNIETTREHQPPGYFRKARVGRMAETWLICVDYYSVCIFSRYSSGLFLVRRTPSHPRLARLRHR